MLGMERLVIVGTIKKVGFLQGFTGGRERKGCVLCTRCLKLSVPQYMDFCVEFEEKNTHYTVYGIMSVLLLLLVLGFLIVFREFGMISE